MARVPNGKYIAPASPQPYESSEDNEPDFLGLPLSHEPSESDQSSYDTVTDDRERSDDSDESYRGPRGNVTINRPNRPRPSPKKIRIRRGAPPYIKTMIKLQNSYNLLIPRLPFQRLVREIMHERNPELRLQSTTLEALRESSEMFMVSILEDAFLLCLECKRVTVMDTDFKTLAAVDQSRRPLMGI
ncbi:histone H3-like centromeric protein cnp1 isoform X2 [Contarinia nasturtii]|nr:histone H3-like centromeric protein cnp1 isoform X2 [Contarinia nasturtii]